MRNLGAAHFLFAAVKKAKDKHHDVLVSALDGAPPRVVIRNASYPKYIASGYLLFSRDGYLMAQKFDPNSQRSSGDAFLVHPNQLDFAAAFGWAAFDASRNGVISAKEQIQPGRVLRWYSRSGVVLQTMGSQSIGICHDSRPGETALLLAYLTPEHMSRTSGRLTWNAAPGGERASRTVRGAIGRHGRQMAPSLYIR